MARPRYRIVDCIGVCEDPLPLPTLFRDRETAELCLTHLISAGLCSGGFVDEEQPDSTWRRLPETEQRM